jgi:hypothetical protein
VKQIGYLINGIEFIPQHVADKYVPFGQYPDQTIEVVWSLDDEAGPPSSAYQLASIRGRHKEHRGMARTDPGGSAHVDIAWLLDYIGQLRGFLQMLVDAPLDVLLREVIEQSLRGSEEDEVSS